VQREEEVGASSVSMLPCSLRYRAPAVRRGMPCWEGWFSVLVCSYQSCNPMQIHSLNFIGFRY